MSKRIFFFLVVVAAPLVYMSWLFCMAVVKKMFLHQKRGPNVSVTLPCRSCATARGQVMPVELAGLFSGKPTWVIYRFSRMPPAAESALMILLEVSSRWGGVAASLHFPMCYFKTTPSSGGGFQQHNELHSHQRHLQAQALYAAIYSVYDCGRKAAGLQGGWLPPGCRPTDKRDKWAVVVRKACEEWTGWVGFTAGVCRSARVTGSAVKMTVNWEQAVWRAAARWYVRSYVRFFFN